MKTIYALKRILVLLPGVVMGLSLAAQSTLELTSASATSTSGPSIANIVATFRENANNPLNNVSTAYNTPTITATFSLSNQQYTLPASQMSTGTDVVFGATINAGAPTPLNAPTYTTMGGFGSPVNTNFTASEATPAGSGISTTNNYGVGLFVSTSGLFNIAVPTLARYYMADLTVTFNVPVMNPVLHFAGLGGSLTAAPDRLGYSAELEVQTPGIILSKLSGSSELNVTPTAILNSALHPSGPTGAGAASGSVLATGTNITVLRFRVYLRGDGVLSWWGDPPIHTGDGFMMGISLLTSNMVLLPWAPERFIARPEENRTGPQTSFYPNPVKDKLTIISRGRPLQSARLMTINGATLQQFHTFTSGQSIDLRGYPAGMYFVQLKNTAGYTSTIQFQKE